MQKGSRSGAEVSRNNDGVLVQLIYPGISYGVARGDRHVAQPFDCRARQRAFKRASCLFVASAPKRTGKPIRGGKRGKLGLEVQKFGLDLYH